MEGRTTIQVSNALRQELKRLAARRDKSYQELLADMIGVFSELDREKTILSIPTRLAEKVEERMAATGFRTKSDYVAFLLRLILSEDQEAGRPINEKSVRTKLRSLGYL